MLKTVVYGNQVRSESLKDSAGTSTKLIYVVYSHNKYAYIHIYIYMLDTYQRNDNRRMTNDRRTNKGCRKEDARRLL